MILFNNKEVVQTDVSAAARQTESHSSRKYIHIYIYIPYISYIYPIYIIHIYICAAAVMVPINARNGNQVQLHKTNIAQDKSGKGC